jgi:hypothetical protein
MDALLPHQVCSERTLNMSLANQSPFFAVLDFLDKQPLQYVVFMRFKSSSGSFVINMYIRRKNGN